jgi:hypothetical protein
MISAVRIGGDTEAEKKTRKQKQKKNKAEKRERKRDNEHFFHWMRVSFSLCSIGVRRQVWLVRWE